MFERFGRDVREAVLVAAEEAAVRRGDPRIGTEHLLIGVSAVDETLTRHGVDVEALRALLRHLDSRALHSVGIDIDPEQLSPRQVPAPRSRWSVRRRDHRAFTRGAKHALERALRICVDERHRRITTSHLLAALVVGGSRDPAVRLLRAADVDPSDIDADIRRGWRSAP